MAGVVQAEPERVRGGVAGQPVIADVGPDGGAGAARVGAEILDDRSDHAERIEDEHQIGLEVVQGGEIAATGPPGAQGLAQEGRGLRLDQAIDVADEAEASVDDALGVGRAALERDAAGLLPVEFLGGEDQRLVATASQFLDDVRGADFIAADEGRRKEVRKGCHLHAASSTIRLKSFMNRSQPNCRRQGPIWAGRAQVGAPSARKLW